MSRATPDSVLVSRVMLLDDRKAFATLVERYRQPVRRFFLNVTTGDTMLADDLSQETFVKCYYKIKQFKGLARFSTWLHRIAYNVFCDYMRTAGTTLHTHDIPEAATSPRDDVRIDVMASLACLSPTERAVVTLFYIEDHTVDEVARILSLPQGTVKSHLARSRSKLSQFFKANGYETNRHPH